MAAKKPIVPPGGFAGLNQQTPATQALFGNAVRSKARRKKRKVSKTTRRKVRRRAANPRKKVARKKKPARLVKGSAAAKRHMAKLRRMRKR